MRVLHVNQSDLDGGAARAAYRIHHCLREAGLDSRMRVVHRKGDDTTVAGGPPTGKWRVARRLLTLLARYHMRGFRTANPVLHSSAWPPTGLGREINAAQVDVVHLHWLGSLTLSIEEVGRLRKPVVWTLHDMWAFCGAEHYADDLPNSRFRLGYRRNNVPAEERARDLNRETWLRKRRHWKNLMQLVCPSQWLATCARDSMLFRDWPVDVIPNPIDLDVWRPLPKALARAALGFAPSARLVLLGAPGGLKDPRKGGDLALQALARLAAGPHAPDALLVFGQSAGTAHPPLPMPTRFLGPLHDDLSLALAYSAADVFVAPSRQDNLPNTVVESLACGTPVVAFNIGGLPDMVAHEINGWLATPFDPENLAMGIAWVLADEQRRVFLGASARGTAEAQFAPTVIARRYLGLYGRVLAQHGKCEAGGSA